MDLREEGVPFVKDFRRDIKKVRVVVFLDGKEAGAKAVSGEKLVLGLAPTDKLSAPFRVVQI